MKILKVLLSLNILFITTLSAQDFHFSQFYMAPTLLNPALTGLMLEEVRGTIQYRNQWQSVTTPYNTMLAAIDFSLFREQLEQDLVGVGLTIFNDKAGDADLSTTQVLFSAAYSKSLSGLANHYLSAGFNIGLGQHSIDFNALQFDSQFDGQSLNPTLPTFENLGSSSIAYFDIAAGLAWFYVPDEQTNFYFGASVAHMNQPNISFLDGAEDPLYTKITVHAGLEFPITRGLSLVPRAIVLNQGPYTEFNVGGLFKYRVNPDYGDDYGRTAFYMGVMHRVGDANIAIVRFDYNRMGVSLSYDWNFSKLSRASRANGGFEIAVTYKTWLFDAPANTGPVGCPTW